MARLLPALAAALTLAVTAYFWWGRDPGGAVWLASAIAVGGAVAGMLVPARHARVHTAIAAALMLAVGGFAASRVVHRWPFAWDALADARYAALIATIGVTVAVGLVRGALWARWAALAFAGGSALGGTLNSISLRGYRYEPAWLAAIGVAGALTILAALTRPSVRDRFAARAQHAVWMSRDPLVSSARWAAIASFAAAPMLILYAFGQPVAPATVGSALVIAPVLFAGGVLVVRRRAVGVLVLGVAALALLAHTVASVRYVTVAADVGVVGYYACFWGPAVVLGLAAAALALWRAR